VREKIKVVFSRDAASALMSDGESNVWNIQARSGCAMAAHWPDESAPADEDAFIIIAGQPAAVGQAVDEILCTVKKVAVFRLDEDSTSAQESAEATTKVRNHDGPYTLTVRADQIPQPSVWTPANFERYVASLTMGRMPGSVARKVYDGPEGHKDTVVRLLLAVFKDPAAQAAITTRALKIALSFLVNAGQSLIGPARELFYSLWKSGLRIDLDVFNLIASGAVLAKNLLAFQVIIRSMILSGHEPNLRTWLLFLSMVEAEEVRRYIIEAMETKGFFETPQGVIGVAQVMASHDALRAIRLGQSVQELLAVQESTYGPHWRLTTRAGNNMLEVFGRYGKFDDAKVILEAMFGSNCVYAKVGPNTSSLNTLLRHCRLQGRIDDAIGIIKLLHERGFDQYDKITFHILFTTAWHLQRPHLASAVSRYAHLADATSWRMRQYVIFFLDDHDKRKRLLKPLAKYGLWDERHGWKYPQQDFVRNLFLCDARHMLEPLSISMTGDRIAGRLYEKYSDWAFSTSRLRRPAVPLGEFLEKALARDRQLLELTRSGPQENRERIPDLMLPIEMPLEKKSRSRVKLGVSRTEENELAEDGAENHHARERTKHRNPSNAAPQGKAEARHGGEPIYSEIERLLRAHESEDDMAEGLHNQQPVCSQTQRALEGPASENGKEAKPRNSQESVYSEIESLLAGLELEGDDEQPAAIPYTTETAPNYYNTGADQSRQYHHHHERWSSGVQRRDSDKGEEAPPLDVRRSDSLYDASQSAAMEDEAREQVRVDHPPEAAAGTWHAPRHHHRLDIDDQRESDVDVSRQRQRPV
jgi:hypothetical protein